MKLGIERLTARGPRAAPKSWRSEAPKAESGCCQPAGQVRRAAQVLSEVRLTAHVAPWPLHRVATLLATAEGTTGATATWNGPASADQARAA